jgi:hypothetical protein
VCVSVFIVSAHCMCVSVVAISAHFMCVSVVTLSTHCTCVSVAILIVYDICCAIRLNVECGQTSKRITYVSVVCVSVVRLYPLSVSMVKLGIHCVIVFIRSIHCLRV